MKTLFITDNSTELTIADHEVVLVVDERASSSDFTLRIGAHAQVNYLWLAGETSDAEITRTVKIGDHSELTAWQLFSGESSAKFRLDHQLGEQVKFINKVLVHKGGTAQLTVTDYYRFQEPSAYGRFEIEGFVTGLANLSYSSDLQIAPAAQQTDSRIDMKLHLLSREARGLLLPGLQIDANDVKAGHSATTFKLSPEDAFYLQSRGLATDQIKALLLRSSLNHFLAGLDNEELKQKVMTKLL
jgi:Fe-S cluster assembly protein SufD